MSRACPVCDNYLRSKLWTMTYHPPDGWPLPRSITWYRCVTCSMLYGDGPFDQEMYNRFYREYYGYGVKSTQERI